MAVNVLISEPDPSISFTQTTALQTFHTVQGNLCVKMFPESE